MNRRRPPHRSNRRPERSERPGGRHPRGPARDEGEGPERASRGRGGGGPRPEKNVEAEIIAGRHGVLEALRAGRPVHKLLVADGARGIGEIITIAREQGVPIQTVRRTTLDRQARQVNHQGVAAMAAAHAYAELDDVLARAEDSGEPPFLVALHEVQDPHNLGSVLRTADAAGVHGILIGRHRAVGLTPSVARTSAGAIEHVPVVRVLNLARTLGDLKANGYWIVGTDASGEHDYRSLEYDHPLVLVVGGEDRGLGNVVAQECDWVVKLPMRGHLNSLNASVAAAICIYEVFARRTKAER